SRSLRWRVAQLNQAVEEDPLEIAHRAAWADGAARQHGKLCKI
ncbi:hypothetical protein A2U01_0117887, partial [Trifolium medium]|nr:hypothetical protein [Trifolium medium]